MGGVGLRELASTALVIDAHVLGVEPHVRIGVLVVIVTVLGVVLLAALGRRVEGDERGNVDRVLLGSPGLVDGSVDCGLEVLLVDHQIGFLHGSDLLGLELEIVRLGSG